MYSILVGGRFCRWRNPPKNDKKKWVDGTTQEFEPGNLKSEQILSVVKPFLFCHDRMLFLNLRGENSTGIQCLITSNTHIGYFVSHSIHHSTLQMAKFQNSWNLSIPFLAFRVNSWCWVDILSIFCSASDACCREISEILYLDEILVLHTLTLYIYYIYILHGICKLLLSTSIYSSFLQVVPGRAGGGSFRRKKNYIAKKEFAYRMCARRPTSAMPKPCLCCERAFCCSMVVMWPVLMHVMSFDVVVMSFDAMWLLVLCHVTWCNAMSCDVPCNGHVVCSKWFCDNAVIQSTILYYKVLLCTTKYYSSTTLYYKVLLQYYSVLQSTTPVLLQYYSVLHSTTTLLQYYPVLQSTTPVLLCTANYYSSTTLYYKVLLQYYSVLHSTTTYYSSTTLYYKVLLQYYSVLQSSIHDWSLTHMNRYLHDWCPSHMKRHLQCAEQQESSSNFTKYCTCHAKWLWWLIHVTYETSFTMRGATGVTIQLHQILRLPRKMNLMIDPRHIWNVIYNARSNRSHNPTSPNTAPATQNESHDWSASHMKRHLQCAEQQTSHHNFTKYCACHAKWISWLIRVTYETSFTMRGASKVTLQPHQILRLPRNLQVQDFSGNSMNCFRQ